MIPNWQRVRVEQIASARPNALSTGPFGSAISAQFFVDEGVPVIRGSNLSEEVGTRLKDEGLVFLTDEKAATFTRSEARRGDLVFTCWGTIGQVGLVDKRSRYERYIVSNKQMKLTPDRAKADSLYLYYAFSSPIVMASIQGQAIGSSVPGFNLGQLRSVELDLPPLPEQRRIAAILGALDDKIELNRKMNRTLEEMAQALFKSWFIDFDGHDPEGLVDGELGPIPRGWRVGPVKAICSAVRNGSTPKRSESEFWSGGTIPWFKTGELTDSVLLDSEEHITNAGLEGSACSMFPAGTVLIAIYAAPTVGRVGLLTSPATSNQACTALVPHPHYGSHFVLETLRAARQRLNAVAVGSAQQNISKAIVESFAVVIPPPTAVDVFKTVATPIFNRIEVNARQAKTLTELRDALLPKLISGEIRVPEAEDAVEAAL